MSTSLKSHEQYGICRDCLREIRLKKNLLPARCPFCANPRLFYHRNWRHVAIGHIDCDAFFAAIEKRDNPELLNKPVIVGGGKRGVVATACYIARSYGVHSAMPMFKALKLCPEAVVINGQYSKYSQASNKLREMLNDLSPVVEMASIDEAYIDLSGTHRLHGMEPTKTLMRLANDVEKNIGITVSVGLGNNKFLAKIASDLDKPLGFTIISQSEAEAFLAPRPITIIPGIGPKMAASLARNGIYNVSQLQAMSVQRLINHYGSYGITLWQRARGIDNRCFNLKRKIKSVSNETTFDYDISSLTQLSKALIRLADKVALRLDKKSLVGDVITIKLKDSNFNVITRRITIGQLTSDQRIIASHGLRLLKQEINGTVKFRLIGIGVAGVTPATAVSGELFANSKDNTTTRLVNDLTSKFGAKVIAGRDHQ